MENYGGNYTKLNIKWHTGIRFFVLPNYGGVRFCTDAAMANSIFSIGETDSNVRAVGTIYANRMSCGYDSGVANSIGCSEWFRSSGSTGWFNATYSGGIYMEDSVWVRTYNNKKLYVGGGTAEIATSGNVTAYYSDMRLKTRTGGIDNALEKVNSLSGFKYVENDLAKELGYSNDKQQVGLSAQQIQAVLPEAVSLAPIDMDTDENTGEITSKSGENYLTVDYSKLVPLLVEAIKELTQEVESLKTKLKEK
jgi:trimeric autotransporter adhesin